MDCGYLKINKCDELTACFAVAYDSDTHMCTYIHRLYYIVSSNNTQKVNPFTRKAVMRVLAFIADLSGGRFSVNS